MTGPVSNNNANDSSNGVAQSAQVTPLGALLRSLVQDLETSNKQSGAKHPERPNNSY